MAERRRTTIAIAIYVLVTIVYFATAPSSITRTHTPYNHFALLAEDWLRGRLDLGGAPPAYTGNNDFAFFQGKWFVSFPPFPALILLPFVAVAGSADRVRDGM